MLIYLEVIFNLDYIFKGGLTWTSITSSFFSIRVLPKGFLFSSASNAIFGCDINTPLAILNSKVHEKIGKVLNPTLNANPGDISKFPLPKNLDSSVVEQLVELSKEDWDLFEISWDFNKCALISAKKKSDNLIKDSFDSMNELARTLTAKVKLLEEENNKIKEDNYFYIAGGWEGYINTSHIKFIELVNKPKGY